MAKGFVRGSSQSDRDRLKSELYTILSQLEDLCLSNGHLDGQLLNQAGTMVIEIVNAFFGYELQSRSGNPKEVPPKPDHAVKFKPFDLPKFNNTVRGYISFKAKFNTLIKDTMSKDLALMRLKEECVEPQSTAHQLVKGKNTLSEAFAVLDRQFGRQAIVRDAILKDVRQLQKVSNPRCQRAWYITFGSN